MSEEARRVRTCKYCSTDNPINANVCNGCGNKLNKAHVRWECPKCRYMNMDNNKECICGNKRPMTMGQKIFWGMLILYILFLMSASPK